MSNITNAKNDCATHVLWWDWFRVCLGLVGVFSNGMIVLPILRYEALRRRKEYIIIASLAFGDCIRALSKANANIQRILLFARGLDCSKSTVMFCWITVHGLMKYSHASAVLMLLIVSCDRLFAVWKPTRYFKMKQRYAVKFVILGFALAALNLVAGTIDIFDNKDEMVSSLCLGSTMFTKFYLASNKSMESIISVSSVIVYMFVPYVYRRGVMNRVSDKDDRQMEQFRKNQRKIMITLGMSSVFTLLLDSIPRVLGFYFKTYLPKYKWNGVKFGQALTQLTNVNGILNFVLCVTRHSELRYAMKAAVQMKNLPANMKNWTGYNTQISTKHSKTGNRKGTC